MYWTCVIMNCPSFSLTVLLPLKSTVPTIHIVTQDLSWCLHSMSFLILCIQRICTLNLKCTWLISNAQSDLAFYPVW
jgi:hypothetical protein